MAQPIKLTNSKVKLYSSLKHKKYRRQYGLFIADGAHLVEEALKSDWQIEAVVTSAESLGIALDMSIPKNLLAITGSRQIDRISPSRTPQGILAIVKSPDQTDLLPGVIKNASSLIACDNISDPGNLGTIIRSAAAFFYDAVILLGNCADIYNPKVVRATQGALFKIPVIEQLSMSNFITDLADKFNFVVLSNKAPQPLSSVVKISRPLLVVGSETAGISPEVDRIAEYRFRIEQSSEVESLNAAVAAGIAMYKFAAK